MYNRYIPETTQHCMAGRAEPRQDGENSARPKGDRPGGLLAGLFGGRAAGEENRAGQTLDRLLKGLHLEHLDAGDILLGLIVLFLVLEDGDDLDLVITLGLTILLSLGEK